MSRPHGRRRSGLHRLLQLLVLVAVGGFAWLQFVPESLQADLWSRLSRYIPADAGNPQLYKWKDDQGHWTVTDQPPQGREYEIVKVHPETNVLPPGVPPEADQD